jgi:ferric-dicitrate binding protein FerR (iron transport regulator)
MTKEEYLGLVTKIAEGTATNEEVALYNASYDAFQSEQQNLSEKGLDLEGLKKQSLENFYKRINQQGQPAVKTLWRYAAAAALLLGFGLAIYLWLKPHAEQTSQGGQPLSEQIDPVKKGIVLIIGNGKQVMINSKYHGKIATLNGAQVSQADSSLNYQPTGADEGQVSFNTLANNSGNKFSLTLADGTAVILDAASTITYPVVFKGPERKVNITGQAYLTVKHDAAHPFRVQAKDEIIEDIGTSFNINAYDDEAALKTTLVEGAVKVTVTRSKEGLFLKPGEQAIYAGEKLKAIPADMEVATAWLQGKLVFHHEPLQDILKRVSRIYGVQFTWQDEELKNIRFGGSVNRTKKLAVVLDFFRKTGEVDFVADGKTIKVFKNKK